MSEPLAEIWKQPEVAQAFVAERARLLPHRTEQLAIMVRVLRGDGARSPRSVLDLGCGSGVLLGAVLAAFPEAGGIGVDYSPAMLEAAREALAPFEERVALVTADLADPGWVDAVSGYFDAVVSGYCIHHLPDERKQEVYDEIHQRLAPGGMFVHTEHVASATPAVEMLFNDAMTEHLYHGRREAGEAVTLDEVREQYLARPDRDANLLAPLDTQLGWLRELGFAEVDCYWKWFELAIFGGRKSG
jgi:tRNA (cmo5U34)-methyltransferase